MLDINSIEYRSHKRSIAESVAHKVEMYHKGVPYAIEWAGRMRKGLVNYKI